ncbi:signal peptidase I [Coprothermobacteraceae bacterium]|nr:signal peptidase I [Coprothermobacteraceae bacterium]
MLAERIFREILEWLIALVLAAAIVFPVRAYVLQPYRVYMTSMVPTLVPGDIVVGIQTRWYRDGLHRGDIVILGGEFSDGQLYVKRVIGLPGETIEIRDGFVYVDGQRINEPWLPDTALGLSGEMPALTLGDGQYFVLGDNRAASRDSRAFGPVSRTDIKAKVALRVYPFDRIRGF